MLEALISWKENDLTEEDFLKLLHFDEKDTRYMYYEIILPYYPTLLEYKNKFTPNLVMILESGYAHWRKAYSN